MGDALGEPLAPPQSRCVPFQALLKKHEALMSDLSAYGSSIQALREQAQSCRVSVAFPSAVTSCQGGRGQAGPAPARRCCGPGQHSCSLTLKAYETKTYRRFKMRFLKTPESYSS